MKMNRLTQLQLQRVGMGLGLIAANIAALYFAWDNGVHTSAATIFEMDENLGNQVLNTFEKRDSTDEG